MPTVKKRLSRQEIENVLKQGKRVSGALFSVASLPADTERYAVVVGKKVSNKAVVRNKVRRRIRNILPQQIATKTHVVVHAKPTTLRAPYTDYKEELRRLLAVCGKQYTNKVE